MVQTEFPKLEEFLIGLQRSWEKAIKSIEIAKKAMKRQFKQTFKEAQLEKIWTL